MRHPLHAVLLLLPLAGACSDSGTTPPAPEPIATFTLQPHDLVILAGESAAVQVEARNAAGTVIPTGPVAFAVRDPSIATIDAAGTVSALRTGATTVTAVAGEHGRAIALTVVSPDLVTAVGFLHGDMALEVGRQHTVVGFGVDADGVPVRGLPVQWSTTDHRIVRVATDGRITAVAPGTARVIATVAGKQGSIAVTVTAP